LQIFIKISDFVVFFTTITRYFWWGGGRGRRVFPALLRRKV
jgi:hypothetical protein